MKEPAILVAWDLRTDKVPVELESDRELRQCIFKLIFLLSPQARQDIMKKLIETIENYDSKIL